jgi:DeoR/GlpR family transcriptional regulator of sugar metabolism
VSNAALLDSLIASDERGAFGNLEGSGKSEALDAFHFDIAFIGAGGVSSNVGLSDYTLNGARFRSRMIASAATAYLLADARKFNRQTPYPVLGADLLTAVISDEGPKGDLARWFRNHKIRVIQAR